MDNVTLAKPYDLEALKVAGKNAGLELAEDGMLKAYDTLRWWLKESAKMSATPADDVAMLVLDQIDGRVRTEIDKLDGKVG